MKGSEIVTRARLVLNDPSSIRWSNAEFALWITDGCGLIAIQRPESCARNVQLTLVAGARQTISGLTPPGLRLLDVVRVIATGRSVRLVDRQQMDSYRPGWYNDPVGLPVNYIYDNRDPKTFHVHPPALVDTEIEVIYTPQPEAFVDGNLSSLDLPFDNAWADVLLNYVLYRAYGKDADDAHNAVLAAQYMQAVMSVIAGKAMADVAFSPDLNSQGARPTSGAVAGGA